MKYYLIHFQLVVFLITPLSAINGQYYLPYAGGTERRCTQGNNYGSHTGIEKYALDFAMPIGTEIYAARGGAVIIVVENFYDNNGGANNGNRVVIDHGDNTYALYLHLTHNGALVAVGDVVETGQLIALSGNTGQSTGPHLHFMVMNSGASWYSQSISVTYNDVTSNGGVPEAGNNYISGNYGTTLRLNSAIPNTAIIQGSPFSTSISIKNNTSSSWSGDLALALHSSSDQFVKNLEVKTGQTISAGQTKSFPFSSNLIDAVPKNYKLVLKSSKNGNWFNVGTGSYNNPQDVKVIFKMNSALNVVPNPLISGQPISASVELRNYSGSEAWTGNLALALHDNNGGFLGNIEELTNRTINANSTPTFQFYKSSINQAPGTFRLVLKMTVNGEWKDIAAGSYTNPLSINVTGQTVATPAFSPSPGTYSSARTVTLSCATTGAIIRYTLNGSEPTSSSTQYSNPLNISSTTTIKAKAFLSGWTASETATGTYTINTISTVATPTFSPSSGTQPVSVTINCATSGATIRFTTNGSDPTESSSIYSSILYFNGSSAVTLKAKAWKSGMNASLVTSATYSGIQGDGNDVPTAATVISSTPHSGNYQINPEGDVDWYRTYLSSNTQYTFENSSATNFDSEFYLYGTGNSSGTSIGSQVAFDDDGGVDQQPKIIYTPSATGYYYLRVAYYSNNPAAKSGKDEKPKNIESTGDYTLNITAGSQQQVATPGFSPSPGTYTSSQIVYLTCVTPGAIIRYTTNGSDPTSSSTQYSNYIYITSTTTIKAKAFLSGWTESGTASGTFTISSIQTVAAPSFNPPPGTLPSPQNVYLSSATAGATIRYTTNGSEPTSSSNLYSGPIYVASNTTIKAKAFLSGWDDSYTSTGVYTVSTSQITPCPGIPTVYYGGRTYNTVLIGSQCWLRENLNVGVMINGTEWPSNNGTIEKYCYDNNEANCNTYGALYYWREAMQWTRTEGAQGICPSGWHIPSLNEQDLLESFVSDNGNALKAIGQGSGSGAGTNTSGFSALLAGERDESDYDFDRLGDATYIWSSTEDGSTEAYRLKLLDYSSSINIISGDKGFGWSVRCVKEMSEVNINSPNGGEILVAGSSQNITWSSSYLTNVNLEYSTNNGSSWILIVGSTPASNGSYLWTVPNIATTQGRVRISSATNSTINDISNGAFTIVQPTITATAPNGSEIWRVGSAQNIAWSSSYVTNVKIEYSTNNGSNWLAISNSTQASAGTYQWIVPNTPSTQCKIRVSDAANNNTNDVSNNIFTIYYPQITVASPNGGEQLRSGLPHLITWTANYISSVKIDFTSNNGATWNSIASDVTGSAGSFSWLIPNITSSNCRIRISETGNPSVYDESNSLFSVVNPQITILSPLGSENWRVGSSKSITWSGSNLTNVKIEYSTNSGTNWTTIIASTPSANGTYTWTVPNTTSAQYKIRISDAAYPSLTSSASGNFTVYSPVIQLQSPNGGEVLGAKSTHTIQYNFTPFNYVKLEYSTNSGSTWNLIADEFGGSQYSWLVPEVSSQNCKIRISDASDPEVFDISDNVFRIKNPTITLLSPNGGAIWPVYSQQTITWTSIDVEEIYISFRFNENWFQGINTVQASSGSYTFTVSGAYYSPNQRWIRLSSYPDGGIYDESDSMVVITNPLRLLYPNGGEVFKAGSDVTIRWSEIPDSVYLSKSSLFGFGGYLLRNEPVSGDSFVWRVPIDSTYFARINVFAYNSNSIWDGSDTTFFIYRPTLAISSPLLNAKIASGSNHLITWSSEYLEKVKIEYSTNNGDGWITITDSTSATASSYLWNVPNTPSSNCKIRISEVGDPNFIFVSNGNFQIYQPVKLLYPDNYAKLLIGSTHQIRWEPTPASAFHIDYSTNNGSDWIQITASASAVAGSYNWVIPNTPSSNCRMRIISIDDPASGDTSDYTFNIEGKSIWINNPNGGDVLVINSVVRVSWESFGVNNIIIKLWDQNLIWSSEIIPDSLRKYNWTVPINMGENFRIQIVDADDPGINDYSDSVFAISHTGWEKVYLSSSGITEGYPQAIFAADSLNVTTVGINGIIIKSNDGGATWSVKNQVPADQLYTIKYFNQQNGIAAGYGGVIMRTSNGGETWHRTIVGTNNLIQSAIIDSSSAILVGHQGAVLKTNDFGLNWYSIDIGTSQILVSVHFSNKMNGFIVGTGSTIMKTTDGGESWTAVNTGLSRDFHGVYMADSLTIYLTTNARNIVKSTDGGISWLSVANFPSGDSYIMSPQFLSKDIGYVFTSKRIYKTSDGGINWNKQFYNSVGSAYKYGSHFKNSEIGWSTMSGTTLLKYRTHLPSMPVLKFPTANGITGKSINFNWNNGKRAQNFTLQIAKDENFTSGLLEFSTQDTLFSYNQLANFSVYFWRVRGNNEYGPGDWSITGKFFVSDVPPVPVIVFPPNNSINIPVENLYLQWSRVSDSKSVSKYWVQVSTDTVSAGIYNDSTLTDTIAFIQNPQHAVTYYWRVAANNEAGWGKFTLWQKFTTVPFPPGQVTGVYPADGLEYVAQPVKFIWSGDPGAETYHLQVIENAPPYNVVIDNSALTDTAVLVSSLAHSTNYKWRVRAINAGGAGTWSGENVFRTLGLPGAVEPVSPITGSYVILPATVQFSWRRSTGMNDSDAVYEFNILDSASSNIILTRDSVLSETYFTWGNHRKNINWRVRAKNRVGVSEWSPVQGFTLINKPEKPNLLGPENNSKGIIPPVTLSWSASQYGELYKVQVATDSEFSNIIFDRFNVNMYSATFDNVQLHTQYFWRVIVYNGTADTSYVYSFKTLGNPYASTLYTPANNSVNQPITGLVFKWSKAKERIETIQKYQYQLATDSLFSGIVLNDTTLTDTTKTVNSLIYLTKYYWRVRASNQTGWGDWSEVWKLTTIIEKPANFVLSSPANNSKGMLNPVTVSWSASARAEKYILQVTADSLFTTFVVNDSAQTDLAELLPALGNFTQYYWRVKALNTGGQSDWTPVWSFKTFGNPYASVLYTPANNSVNQPITGLVFRWSKAKERIETILKYQMQIATDSLFTGLILNDSTLTDTTKIMNALSYLTRYHWRVRAQNQTGWGDWSDRWTTTTIIEKPSLTVLASPANNAAQLLQPVILKWHRALRADIYRLEVSESSNFSSLVLVDSTLTDTLKVLPQLEAPKTYYWRVRSSNTGGVSDYSAVWNFRTLGKPLPVTLAAPANNSTHLPVTGVKLTWLKPGEQTMAPLNGGNSRNIRNDDGATSSQLRASSKAAGLVSDGRITAGQGIEGGESILAYWLQTTSDTTGSIYIISDSTLADTFKVLPALNYLTSYYWRVKAKNENGWGGFSGWYRFTTIIERPSQPVLASPANNALGLLQPVTVKWHSALRAEKYALEVSTAENFSSVVHRDTSLTDTSKLLPVLGVYTKYYWRVTAKNAGGTSDISPIFSFKTLGTPAGVALVTPSQNAQNIPVANILFNWTKAYDRIETILGYRFELKTDTTQSGYIILDSLLTDTTKTVAQLQNQTVYYWRVGAKNEAGWSQPTAWSKFTTIVAAPGQVTLQQPAYDAISVHVRPLFKWNRIASAERYLIEVSANQGFTSIILRDTLVTDTVKTFADSLLFNTKYYWRVKASNIGGQGSFSAVWNFTTVKRNINAPANLTAAATGVKKVTLNWADRSDNESGFIIFRKQGDSASTNTLTAIDTSSANSVQYVDTTVATDPVLFSYRIIAYNLDTISPPSNYAVVLTLTDVTDYANGTAPEEYTIQQNYPNPFNPSTTIRYGLPYDSDVRLEIYDISGQKLQTLVDQTQSAGYYEAVFDISGMSSGTYLYILTARRLDGDGEFHQVKKMILLK